MPIVKRPEAIVRAVVLGAVLLALSPTSAAVDAPQPAAATTTLRDAAVVLGDAHRHGIDLDAVSQRVLADLKAAGDGREPVLAEPDTDAVIADALLRYALDFVIGSRRPTELEVNGLQDEIRLALRTGRLLQWYASLIPPDPAYHRLRAVYLEMAAMSRETAWPTVGGWETLELGSEGDRVVRLRERLGLETGAAAYYDAELESIVRQYQELHGLEVDGKVGRRTLAHLDTSLADRLHQIRRNLERYRQQGQQGQQRPNQSAMQIHINLPSYRLTLSDDSGVLASMKVIVGHPDTPTPMINEQIEHLVFSPYWYVPADIAREEVLPAMLKNPRYGHSNGYELRDRETQSPVSVDDWWSGRVLLPLVRQRPGDSNALGRVKFVLPNDRAIYLHDTGRPELFAGTQRALSHGCVRVEKPALLASLLLRSNEGWSAESVSRAMSHDRPKSVKPVVAASVVATYYTVETTPTGEISFYEDIYGRDARKAGPMASSFVDPSPLNIHETVLASLTPGSDHAKSLK